MGNGSVSARDGGDSALRINYEDRQAWSALRADAKRHAQISEIQDLSAAQQALQSLLQRPDLVVVR